MNMNKNKLFKRISTRKNKFKKGDVWYYNLYDKGYRIERVNKVGIFYIAHFVTFEEQTY